MTDTESWKWYRAIPVREHARPVADDGIDLKRGRSRGVTGWQAEEQRRQKAQAPRSYAARYGEPAPPLNIVSYVDRIDHVGDSRWLIEQACQIAGIPYGEFAIQPWSRRPVHVLVRWVVLYVLWQTFRTGTDSPHRWPLARLGRVFKMDHNTVRNGLDNMRDRLASDPRLVRQMERLNKKAAQRVDRW